MEKFSAEEKKSKLSNVIVELSKAQNTLEKPETLEKYFNILEDIYYSENSTETFRHYYSDIFGWISQIDNDYSGKSGDLEILSQNISIIRREYEKCVVDRKKNVAKSIDKLYDHINLDIARINYIKTLQSSSENEMESISQQLLLLNKQMNDEVEKAEDVSKKVNNVYSEFVSILGIFSAIVLVFFGGTSVFANIIAAMDKSSVYKSISVCLITGIMVADIIFTFMWLLAKLLSRSIATEIPLWENYGNAIRRFRIRYPVIFYFNLLGVGLLSLTFLVFIANKYKILNKSILLCEAIFINSSYTFSKKEISLLILGVGGAINVLFAIMYLFAKITDINIGWYINIEYPKAIYVQDINEPFFGVYKENWPKEEILLKEFNTLKQAEKYRIFRTQIERLKTQIINLPKRLFMRYRILSFLNICILIVWIVVNLKF